MNCVRVAARATVIEQGDHVVAGNREAQLEAVLQAALYLLGARQDRMLTIDEWTDLARAVAAC